MLSTDEAGQARSYLATEENFAFLKTLESKNLLHPRRRQLRGSEGHPRGRRRS